MTIERTRRSVLKIDAERRGFIRGHFNADKDDTRFYHLVFNTDNLTVDYIVAALVGIIEQSKQQVAEPQPAAWPSFAFQNSEVVPGQLP
jgi:cytidylate kinase